MRSQAIKFWTVVVLFLAFTPILSAEAPAEVPHVVVLNALGVNQTSNKHYSKVVEIKYGTIVVFESVAGRKSFRVGKLLGSGHTTHIYELLDHPGKAIRIPIEYAWEWRLRYWKKSFLNATIKGGRKIENAGIPSVKIHDYRYDQYVVVDRVEGFTLEEYLLNPDQFSKEDRQKIEKALIEFGLKTVNYSSISDFRPDQMMYDKKRGWLLTDWTWDISKSKNEYETIFSTSWEIFARDSRPSEKQLDFAGEVLGEVIRAIRSKRGIRIPSQCASLFSSN